MNTSIQNKLFLSHFCAILLVSGSVGSFFYNSAIDNLTSSLQSRLKNSAALISVGLNSIELEGINTPSDQDKDIYKQGVNLLRNFVKVNPDIAFIYIMKHQDNDVVFILDSDMEDPAAPGEVYEDVTPRLLEGFIRPSVDEEITTDKWGSFLTGYAPLKGKVQDYLIGIDMVADEVDSKLIILKVSGLLSLFASFLLAVIFSRMLSKSFINRIDIMVGKMASIIPSKHPEQLKQKGDEFQHLTRSLENMADRLTTNQSKLQQHQAALESAKNELEQRVEERTAELVATNQQLVIEIAERERVEQRLKALSHTDHLTGVLNRRALSNRLETECKAITSNEHSHCLVMIDLDKFKSINDNYGHNIGDNVLKHAVTSFQRGLREHDLLARWGGEEFLVVLPSTDIKQAKLIAERLCDDLSETVFRSLQGNISLTASFGVSRYELGEDINQCIKRADNALYQAKASGRNQVIVNE